jgi:hypothetical protein
MKIDEKTILRFDELVKKGEFILQNAVFRPGSSGIRGAIGRPDRNIIDGASANQWKMNCLQILDKVFGIENNYYTEFKQNSDALSSLSGHSQLKKTLAFLKAAKDDYENGYLFDTRTLIEAEIFDDLLEQSEHLLSQGYFQASAVIAGCVLEDALRKLCVKNNITLSAKPKMDSMNSELAKVNVYNLLKQKQITALADLRNKAAHNQGGFTKEDVEDMIRNVRRFMEDYFS